MEQQLDDVRSSAPMRLHCIRQIADVDEETLNIVSAVLDRVLPAAKPERKRRERRQRRDEEKGGGA